MRSTSIFRASSSRSNMTRQAELDRSLDGQGRLSYQRMLSFHVSGSPRFVFLNPLSLAADDSRSVLAVKGSLRRFAPWTAAGRSGRRGCLRGKGDVPASAGPDQRVHTSNPRLEFDCRHGFDVRVTPRDN